MGSRDRTVPAAWTTSILALALTLAACTSSHPSAARKPAAPIEQPVRIDAGYDKLTSEPSERCAR